MYSIEKLIEKANSIHGDKYTYDFTTYKKTTEKMRMICPEHGEFFMDMHTHLRGQGCPKCGIAKRSESRKAKGISKKLTKEEFLNKCKEKFNNKYIYDLSTYKNLSSKITITCPVHGKFTQVAGTHLKSKYGCPKCGNDALSEHYKHNIDDVIKEAKSAHGNKYDYSKVYEEYKNIHNKVSILCPKHGEFWQTPDNHIQGKSCPKCANQLSNAEEEIYEYCCSLVGHKNVIQRDHSVINPLELDIYIPSLNLAIEYNGLRWHSEKFGKDRNYHLNKLKMCNNKGIRLIQIFEDEYINEKDIVFAKIQHLLNTDTDKHKVYGRKCEIMPISKQEAEIFLNKYHIQGFSGSTIHLGALYNKELIAVMSFRKEAKNTLKYELTRFASNYNYVCCGVGGKLFKYFINNYECTEIKSFADRRWTINTDNNIYTQLGFDFIYNTEPDYRYFRESDGIVRHHKFNFRKDRLHNKFGLSLNMTENEMVNALGYTKIYDCGLIKYVWTKKIA